jgi:hypothetical protein
MSCTDIVPDNDLRYAIGGVKQGTASESGIKQGSFGESFY